jgi:putative ABC transport system permease protein
MILLKTFIRHLFRNKLYSVVTILGFALSLTFVLLLSVYLTNELTVDNFHTNKDRIYRLENETLDFSPPIADDLKNSIPEIESFTRIVVDNAIISKVNGQKFKFDYLGVDTSFFEIFSFPLLKGNKDDVLIASNSIVLSQSLALKLFGNTDVINREVFINTDQKFRVSGIMKDFPENTHFKYQDALVNIKAFKDLWGFDNIMEEYGWCSISIYFLAKPNTALPLKAPEILKQFKKNFWLYKEGWANTVEFVPLKQLYFSTKEGNGTKSNSKTLILVLSIIVLLILVLAISNYINLTIAQSTFRGKEVAIKKLMGSSKKRLFVQFIFESILICFIAMFIALFAAKLSEPVFNSLLDTQLHLNEKITLSNLLILVGFFSLIGIISGILPALKITNFKPIEVVKGSLRRKSKSVYSKAFLTFQYTVTITLLTCSWLIAKQTTFLREYDLGFTKDNILQVEYLSSTEKKTTIKNALLQIPGVEGVSLSWGSPLDGGSNQSFDYDGKPVSFQEFRVDSSFFNVFDISINRTKTAYTKEGVYLNETALKVLEFNQIPPSFKMNQEELPVLGIVNDFHFNELRKNIGPIIIRQQQPNSFASNVFLKLNGNNMLQTIDKIKSTYKSLIDETPFELRFVDDTINQWYINEEKTGKIIGYFTLLSFIISFIGILAMSTFYMQQRRKEISIRKVNGATITQILSLLNKDFVKWVGVAFVIAVPITWYVMGRWLENFAYKITMSWWIFALAGITALSIALLTVSWQSFRAATNNPLEALRDE